MFLHNSRSARRLIEEEEQLKAGINKSGAIDVLDDTRSRISRPTTAERAPVPAPMALVPTANTTTTSTTNSPNRPTSAASGVSPSGATSSSSSSSTSAPRPGSGARGSTPIPLDGESESEGELEVFRPGSAGISVRPPTSSTSQRPGTGGGGGSNNNSGNANNNTSTRATKRMLPFRQEDPLSASKQLPEPVNGHNSSVNSPLGAESMHGSISTIMWPSPTAPSPNTNPETGRRFSSPNKLNSSLVVQGVAIPSTGSIAKTPPPPQPGGRTAGAPAGRPHSAPRPLPHEEIGEIPFPDRPSSHRPNSTGITGAAVTNVTVVTDYEDDFEPTAAGEDPANRAMAKDFPPPGTGGMDDEDDEDEDETESSEQNAVNPDAFAEGDDDDDPEHDLSQLVPNTLDPPDLGASATNMNERLAWADAKFGASVEHQSSIEQPSPAQPPKQLKPQAQAKVPTDFDHRIAALQANRDLHSDRIFYDDLSTSNWIIKYEDIDVLEQLGTGGFGTVYRGRLKRTRDSVAFKLFTCQDPDMVASFKREVKILSTLRHEHIVVFRGACVEVPHLCIVTEYMCRGNLYDQLHDDDNNLEWSLMIRWVRDIARGMNYLHTLTPPVIHRDLKSPNVLVNDYNMIKLCDFGMSRTKQRTVIHTKGMGGSPSWMAPECLRGEPFGEKSDVYSFGVVMWEILTREVPWEDKEMIQLIGLVGFRNQTLDIPPPSRWPKGCTSHYVQIINSTWKPGAQDRPSFSDLVPIFEDMAINCR